MGVQHTQWMPDTKFATSASLRCTNCELHVFWYHQYTLKVCSLCHRGVSKKHVRKSCTLQDTAPFMFRLLERFSAVTCKSQIMWQAVTKVIGLEEFGFSSLKSVEIHGLWCDLLIIPHLMPKISKNNYHWSGHLCPCWLSCKWVPDNTDGLIDLSYAGVVPRGSISIIRCVSLYQWNLVSVPSFWAIMIWGKASSWLWVIIWVLWFKWWRGALIFRGWWISIWDGS